MGVCSIRVAVPVTGVDCLVIAISGLVCSCVVSVGAILPVLTTSITSVQRLSIRRPTVKVIFVGIIVWFIGRIGVCLWSCGEGVPGQDVRKDVVVWGSR